MARGIGSLRVPRNLLNVPDGRCAMALLLTLWQVGLTATLFTL